MKRDWAAARTAQRRRETRPEKPLGAVTAKRAAYVAARQAQLKREAEARRRDAHNRRRAEQ
jgi:hypothetical protein